MGLKNNSVGKKKFQILEPMMGTSITAKFFKNKNKNAYLVHASTEHRVIPCCNNAVFSANTVPIGLD